MNEKLLRELKQLNYKSPYKIKYRKHNLGYSLYLEIQRIKIRETINLKGIVISNQSSKIAQDKKLLEKAHEIQKRYNEEYRLNGDSTLLKRKLKEVKVITFFNILKEKKIDKKNTYKNWSNALKHFTAFAPNNLKFSDIDLQFCEDYRRFLLTRISENSTCTYYSVFKAVMNNAVKKGIINSNIASYVQNPIPDTKREFLTVEELEKLSKNGYHIKEIQNAFLFSCFTGFRISDIKNLTWRNIKKDYIEIKQKKTEDNIRVKLSDSAKKILKYQLPVNHKSDKIFTLPQENAINKHIKQWMQENNIDKHITFHCARHTFATMCLTYDIDIYTLSKLLGHKDIKNTQIYAKLIDKKKDEAIDKLPVF